jgi:hypothetical protein
MIVHHPAGPINTSSRWLKKKHSWSLTIFPAPGFRSRDYVVPVNTPFFCNPDAVNSDEDPFDAEMNATARDRRPAANQ